MQAGVDTTFIVAGHRHRDFRHSDARGLPASRVIQLESSDPGLLASALAAAKFDAAVVHMSGYGYTDKGTPDWLVQGLAQYKRETGTKIITVFHELWQKPVLWRKTLVRWYFQRRALRRLFAISDGYVTNTRERFEQNLRRWGPDKPGYWMPVISNIGELDSIGDRDAGLAVIFGLSLGKRRTYDALASRLDVLSQLGIERLVDIGDPNLNIPAGLRSFITIGGQLDDQAVADLLARARYGFIHYGAADLEKSGVFNAYAAHGLCTINLRPGGSDTADIVRGRHYLNRSQIAADAAANLRIAAQIGPAAFAWYQAHNVHAAAMKLARLLSQIIASQPSRYRSVAGSDTITRPGS